MIVWIGSRRGRRVGSCVFGSKWDSVLDSDRTGWSVNHSGVFRTEYLIIFLVIERHFGFIYFALSYAAGICMTYVSRMSSQQQKSAFIAQVSFHNRSLRDRAEVRATKIFGLRERSFFMCGMSQLRWKRSEQSGYHTSLNSLIVFFYTLLTVAGLSKRLFQNVHSFRQLQPSSPKDLSAHTNCPLPTSSPTATHFIFNHHLPYTPWRT